MSVNSTNQIGTNQIGTAVQMAATGTIPQTSPGMIWLPSNGFMPQMVRLSLLETLMKKVERYLIQSKNLRTRM